MQWPAQIKEHGRVRAQFHHVSDLAPTILEAAGIAFPATVHGIEQKPIEGVSLVYTFDDATAKDRRTAQVFEMFVNCGMDHDGWLAAPRPG
jgi:arylsulfatase A-like enzyme